MATWTPGLQDMVLADCHQFCVDISVSPVRHIAGGYVVPARPIAILTPESNARNFESSLVWRWIATPPRWLRSRGARRSRRPPRPRREAPETGTQGPRQPTTAFNAAARRERP